MTWSLMYNLKAMQKAIKKALDKPELYDDEEYHTLKKQYFQIKKLREKQNNDKKAYLGFGYKVAPITYDEVNSLVDGNPADLNVEEDVVESVDVEVMETADV
jgi:hypothetical protein